MRGVRVLAGALAMVLGLGIAALAPQPAAHADPPDTGSTVTDETFTDASVDDSAWQALGGACLTGRPASGGTGVVPSCAAQQTGPVPAMGTTPGYLQLTDSAGNRAGSILYNRPIPATAGVSITFDQFQYGGNGADGIGFFLVDGSTDLTATGGLGGSLGYAQRGDEPGVEGAYVGVGLDAYGNFYGDGEGRGTGCPAGQQSPQRAEGANAPNVITVRGPGSGLIGYCWQGATVQAPVARPVSTLDGTLRVDTDDPAEAQRRVNIQVTPAEPGSPPRIIVQIQWTPGGAWIEELNILAPPNTPSTYKFGLSASTGGSNDVHLIRNALVDTIEPLAALQLEKQVDRTGDPLPAEITTGTEIPYLYTVTNAGEETITALTVADDRVTDVECELTELVPAPAVGSTTTCTGIYVVTDADVTLGEVTNVAQASGSDPVGGDVLSNEATVTVPFTAALSLTKEVETAPPYAVGQQISYSYEVTNEGNATLTTVNVNDNRIPATSLVCQDDVLEPEATTTCTGTYVVQNSHVEADGYVRNTAVATATTPIGQSVTSNEATEQIPVFTDVGVAKSVDDATPLVGQDVTFTVSATNNGPSVAQNVVLADQLPAGRLTYVSHTTSSGTYTPADGLWRVPEIAVDQTVTLTLVATVETNVEVANGVARTSMTQTDIDPSNDSASVTLNPITEALDIAVTKSVTDDVIPLGSQTTFTVTAHNDGPFAATALTLRDVLPTGLVVVSATPSQGSFDEAAGIWDVGALAVDADATLELVVEPQALGEYRNTARLDSVAPEDTNPSNDQDSAVFLVRPPIADLVVIKGVLPETAFVDDQVLYSVTVTNAGPETVEGVFVTDTGSDGVEPDAVVEIGQGEVDLATGRWDIGTLQPGQSVRLLYSATVTAEGTHVNTATVDAPVHSDPTPDNNIDTATLVTDVAPLDIGVTKTVDDDTPVLGQPVTFTVSATHTPDPADPDRVATNVVFSDLLPDGLTFVASDGDGTFDPAAGTWTFATIDPGTTVTRTITATADAVGELTNSVSLVSLDQGDTVPTNNAASATVTVAELADLAVSKTVSQDVAQPGDTVTYTITIENLGPNATDDVEVVDPLPIAADITGWQASASTTFDVDARRWHVGTLTVGQVETLTVDVLVSDRGGSFRNEVVISQSRVEDPNPENDTAFATLFVPTADIEVLKEVDDGAPYVGEQVTFTVAVVNHGPDAAADVTVDDVLPPGLEYVSSTASVGSYDADTGVWTIGTMLPRDRVRSDAQAVLEIVALVTEPGTHENLASSDRSEAFPFDRDLTNNADSAVVVAEIPPTDVSVTKSAEPTSAQVGGSFVFTMTATVAGPGDADGVVLDDDLPAGLLPTEATLDPDVGDGCTITGQNVQCVLGDLVVGDVVTVTVTATAATAGDWTNTVTVATSSPEESIENNTASVDVVVTAPPAPGPPPPAPPPGPGPEPPGPPLPPTGTQPLGVLAAAMIAMLVGAWLLVTARRRERG